MSDPLLSLGFGGDSGAASRLAGFEARAAMAVWGRAWGPKLTAAIKEESPYDDSDGDGDERHLRDSIAFGGVREIASGVSMSWTSDVDWAPFVVLGTDEHEIHARVAKALHWTGPSGDAFATSVDHPAVAPNPFPLRALERLLPEMNASFAELFEEW